MLFCYCTRPTLNARACISGLTRQWGVLDAHLSIVAERFPLCTHVVIVESNLGFESQHHLAHLQNRIAPSKLHFVCDSAGTCGVRTSAASKEAMYISTLNRLEQTSLHISPTVFCGSHKQTPAELTATLKQQLQQYAVFQDDNISRPSKIPKKYSTLFSGKLGGAQDDLCIALQLNLLHARGGMEGTSGLQPGMVA